MGCGDLSDFGLTKRSNLLRLLALAGPGYPRSQPASDPHGKMTYGP
jgi:hypothetical protein